MLAEPRGVIATLRVTCLASGSSANSLLIQLEDRAILVDAGLPIHKLAAALGERGIRPGALDGILITHEHVDHVRSADELSSRYRAPLVGNPATLRQLQAQAGSLECRAFATGSATTVGAFEVASFPVSHDAVDPVGYVVQADGFSIAVMTDLGEATEELHEPIRRSDLVVLEANHDKQKLLNGPYPWHLKRRIMSDRGHLSNRQAAELIRNAMSSHPQTFWLAHLSKRNNSKREALHEVTGFLADHGLAPHVLVTDRDKPSLVWEPPTTDLQLSLVPAVAP